MRSSRTVRAPNSRASSLRRLRHRGRCSVMHRGASGDREPHQGSSFPTEDGAREMELGEAKTGRASPPLALDAEGNAENEARAVSSAGTSGAPPDSADAREDIPWSVGDPTQRVRTPHRDPPTRRPTIPPVLAPPRPACTEREDRWRFRGKRRMRASR